MPRGNLVRKIEGEQFGEITVLKKIGTKGKNSLYLCKCSCGKEFEKIGAGLISGRSKSCGCLQHLGGNKSKHWKGYGEISSVVFNRLKRGATKRKIKWNISIEEIWELFLKQNKKCALTGKEISFPKRNKLEMTASLDRINSSGFYELSNVQWVHKNINMMKQSLSDEEFINLCKSVVDFSQQRI